MPRLRPFYCDIFYDPLTEDVEQLLARFQQTDSVRYEEFSAIWRDMGLSDVFLGIARVGELKRFCRITLATAVKYFLPPYSYQIRVGGLYLMFAFYHTQLAVPPLNIRLALRDWAQVDKFLKDSMDSGHQDVVYIYQKLDAARAIHYTAMPHFLTFQKQRRPKKEAVCADFLGRATAIQELMTADFLTELNNIQSHYEKLKEGTVELSGQASMTHRDLSTHLKDYMSEFITWQQKTFSQDTKDKNSGDDEEKPTEAEASSNRARLLSSIKQKSYRNVQEASKARRHRQTETVESSSSEAEQAPQRKRPPSLRARTWKSLGMMQEKSTVQAWLLSAPEQQEKVPMKRTYQVAPWKP
ncbi:snRNA-activating protein complex subunit 1-like [Morone saxatilis]|uniref:snRNA-activating protein complex subunit 1-like n=1 Tax=Morone saxatilis TaxID=34816 RepID=UPI0015E205D8|nr:snRNA-activating protein complex subunit 1-like [Morone saxatilis]